MNVRVSPFIKRLMCSQASNVCTFESNFIALSHNDCNGTHENTVFRLFSRTKIIQIHCFSISMTYDSLTALPFTDGSGHLCGDNCFTFFKAVRFLREISIAFANADLQRYGRTTFPVNAGQLRVE